MLPSLKNTFFLLATLIPIVIFDKILERNSITDFIARWLVAEIIYRLATMFIITKLSLPTLLERGFLYLMIWIIPILLWMRIREILSSLVDVDLIRDILMYPIYVPVLIGFYLNIIRYSSDSALIPCNLSFPYLQYLIFPLIIGGLNFSLIGSGNMIHFFIPFISVLKLARLSKILFFPLCVGESLISSTLVSSIVVGKKDLTTLHDNLLIFSFFLLLSFEKLKKKIFIHFEQFLHSSIDFQYVSISAVSLLPFFLLKIDSTNLFLIVLIATIYAQTGIGSSIPFEAIVSSLVTAVFLTRLLNLFSISNNNFIITTNSITPLVIHGFLLRKIGIQNLIPMKDLCLICLSPTNGLFKIVLLLYFLITIRMRWK